MKYCRFSCMECWSVRGQYPTSLELLWVNLLDLGKFFNSHNLDYLLCSKNAPDLCFNYYTFHIHTLLSKFFYKISCYVIDIKACLCSLLKVFTSIFKRSQWTFPFSLVPVYTDKDQRMAVMSIVFLLLNKRWCCCVERTEEKCNDQAVSIGCMLEWPGLPAYGYTSRYDDNIKSYFQRLVMYWCVRYSGPVVNVIHCRSTGLDSRSVHGSLYCTFRWETWFAMLLIT